MARFGTGWLRGAACAAVLALAMGVLAVVSPVAGAVTGAAPIGNVELVADARGAIRVAGWALDPDGASPIPVHAYVDGVLAGGALADIPRPDVAALVPGLGDRHGFDFTVPVISGRRTVCVYGINFGGGSVNPLLGCRSLDLLRVEPIGVIDGLASFVGRVHVSGWAFDADDVTQTIPVHAYVDGVLAGGVTADEIRDDVAAAHPGAGRNHGYFIVAPAPAGLHRICVYGINVGAGIVNPLLACRDATVLAHEPIGNLERVTGGPGVLRVEGWTFDPSESYLPVPLTVHVYVDGALAGVGTTSLYRPDVAAMFPAYGWVAGFSVVVPARVGSHAVRVYAMNVGPGAFNPEIGHATVRVG